MAVKYVRESFRERALGLGTRLEGPAAQSPVRRQRQVVVVCLGLMVLAWVMLSGGTAVSWIQFGGQPVVVGPGTVVEKAVAGADTSRPAYRVKVEIALPGGPKLTGAVRVDAARWQDLEQGDQVLVKYRVARSRQRVSIVELAPAQSR